DGRQPAVQPARTGAEAAGQPFRRVVSLPGGSVVRWFTLPLGNHLTTKSPRHVATQATSGTVNHGVGPQGPSGTDAGRKGPTRPRSKSDAGGAQGSEGTRGQAAPRSGPPVVHVLDHAQIQGPGASLRGNRGFRHQPAAFRRLLPCFRQAGRP